ncbi:hypothetical protein ACE41A_02460 [Bacillus cytotoxicus]|uniref:hypothetical protein n=1 Tax=Bacillus cytotoxicus TaxID=580165 RepID=UPI0035CC7134
MKKLLVLVVSAICICVVGCSTETKKADAKEEVKEKKKEKKKDDTYKETVELKDAVRKSEKSAAYYIDWDHTIDNFTIKIPAAIFTSGADANKGTAIALQIEGVNTGKKDVLHTFNKLEMVDNQGHSAKVLTDNPPNVINVGKKHSEMVFFTFEGVKNYKDIKSFTLKYPLYFGADDDAYQTVKRNEITFKIK